MGVELLLRLGSLNRRRLICCYQPHLEGGVKFYRILASITWLMRVNSLRLITRLVTGRRPIASRLAQPVAWLEEYLTPATKGAALPKTLDYCRSPPPRKLSSGTVARCAVNSVCTTCRVFPRPAWSPSWLSGGGFSPSLRLIRTGIHSTTLCIRAEGLCVTPFGSSRCADKKA